MTGSYDVLGIILINVEIDLGETWSNLSRFAKKKCIFIFAVETMNDKTTLCPSRVLTRNSKSKWCHNVSVYDVPKSNYKQKKI